MSADSADASRGDRRWPALALMGPTASGKTELALQLADRFPVDLISVDSALVYRGMDVGTAKPSPELLARYPHALVDIREPHQRYSAAEFAADARRAMATSRSRARVPLLVGGTGLYFRALLGGLAPMPAADPTLRASIEAEAAERGWPALHRELAEVDADAATRIRPGDGQRIQRALEVFRLTGQPISALQREAATPQLGFRVLRLVVAPEQRSVLHQRIAQRFDAMLEAGFLDEMRRLREDPRLHPGLGSMRAVGYRQAWQYLDGELDAAAFRDAAIAATRQLAKRQFTWLRRELDAIWRAPERGGAPVHELVDRFLDASGSLAGPAGGVASA